MNILVRLPNWLGDMVMSSVFIDALHHLYPSATVDVIVKKNLGDMVPFLPYVNHSYLFDKQDSKGLRGAYQFGREVKKQKQYNLFFCLPNSFSSALMGYTTGAFKRIGFKKEFRNLLLTESFHLPKGLHRVDEYLHLLESFAKKPLEKQTMRLHSSVPKVNNRIIINFNSEASSRRMPVNKAADILLDLNSNFHHSELIVIGSKADQEHINDIVQLAKLPSVQNKAGATNLTELINLIASGTVMLSTDSGPAHVANALGVPTVILFGAGNEINTAPYNSVNRTVLRYGALPCEPCVKNICKFGEPKCLLELNQQKIINAVSAIINKSS